MSLKNLSAKIRIPKLLEDKLKNKRVNQIYKKFEKSLKINQNFVVAVSGGSDSMALAFLSKIYSIKNNLNCKFLIVDHRLRLESSKEAKLVKKTLKNFLINSKILIWKGKKPHKNIQSESRIKRYELISKYCDKYEIKNILLGHHKDDLFENFFIRLLRGSGLKGLVSLDIKNIISNKYLIRPLLDQEKDDLIFLSSYVFNFYIKDPSNENIKFKRIRVRKLLNDLQSDGLDKNKFIRTINNLKYSNEAINFYVKENIEKNTFFSYKKKQLILNEFFFNQPYEIIFRSLSESIRFIGKNYYSTRGRKLDGIIKNLANKHSFKSTLGGCIIEKVNHTVIITKEH